jgi:hypothetical protein
VLALVGTLGALVERIKHLEERIARAVRAEMLICAGLGRFPSQTHSQAGVTFTACRPFFP